MVEYEEIEGNLLDLHDQGNFDMIGHGCNCHKMMATGIARQIADRYNDAFRVDYMDPRNTHRRLGDYTLSEEQSVLNLYTQYNPGRAFDVEAFTICMRKVNLNFPGLHIGLPQIGCGIAGGDWNQVKEIIKKELSDMKVTVVIYKPNKNENTTT